jgi:hypothetical protein
MNLKIIACKVFWREISVITANSPHYCDITYLRQGLHSNPNRLQNAILQEISAVESGEDVHTSYPHSSSGSSAAASFDAILLFYALCAGSVAGLCAEKHPLVIPRAHDCISLLLGSTERYNDYFFKHKGTFWSSVGWSECGYLPDEGFRERNYAKYKEKRGIDLVDKLIEADERWKKNYNRLTFIEWDEIDSTQSVEKCRRCADYNGWDFDLMHGDSSLLRRFVNGDWNEDVFLVVPPGNTIVQSYDDKIFTSIATDKNN